MCPAHQSDFSKWGNPGRKGILIAGGVHCREWVAPTTTLYIAQALLKGAAPELLGEYDWTFVPNLNPDGYKYTWEKDRFWRKTRSRDSDCGGGQQFSVDPLSSPVHSNAGADGNRNWGYHWKDTKSHGYQVRARPRPSAHPCAPMCVREIAGHRCRLAAG